MSRKKRRESEKKINTVGAKKSLAEEIGDEFRRAGGNSCAIASHSPRARIDFSFSRGAA
jgi:hypothetical protein